MPIRAISGNWPTVAKPPGKTACFGVLAHLVAQGGRRIVAASFQLAGAASASCKLAATGAAQPKDGCPLVVPLSSNRHDRPPLQGTITQAEGARPVMEVRYFRDPDTGLPHIYNHGVTEAEVLQVLRKPGPGDRG